MDIELVTDPYACMMYYRVTTCRPGRGHIVAASRLQLASSSLMMARMSKTGFILCLRPHGADALSDAV